MTASTKRSTDNMHELDIRKIHRKGLLIPGRSFTWQWSRRGNVIATIGGMVDTTNSVTLHYRTRRHGGFGKTSAIRSWWNGHIVTLVAHAHGGTVRAVVDVSRYSGVIAPTPAVIANRSTTSRHALQPAINLLSGPTNYASGWAGVQVLETRWAASLSLCTGEPTSD